MEDFGVDVSTAVGGGMFMAASLAMTSAHFDAMRAHQIQRKKQDARTPPMVGQVFETRDGEGIIGDRQDDSSIYKTTDGCLAAAWCECRTAVTL